MAELSKEREIPIGLIVVGELLLAFGAWRVAGSNVGLLLGILAGISVLGVGLMIAAAFLTAIITKTSFGELGPAALKLAATYLVSTGLSLILRETGFGGLVGSVVTFSLMLWLFELEVPYAIIFTIIYFALYLALTLTLTAMMTRPSTELQQYQEMINR